MKKFLAMALALAMSLSLCARMTQNANATDENEMKQVLAEEQDVRVIELNNFAKEHSFPRKTPQPAGQDIIDAVAANSVKYADRSGFNKVLDDPAGKATRLAAILVPEVNSNTLVYTALDEKCFICFDADKDAAYVHVSCGDSMYLKLYAKEDGETWFECNGNVIGIGQAIHVGDDHYVAYIPVKFEHVVTVNLYLDTPWARIELPVDGTPYLYRVQLVPGVKNDYNVVFHNPITDRIVGSAYEGGIRRQLAFYGADGLLDLTVATKMSLEYFINLPPAA